MIRAGSGLSREAEPEKAAAEAAREAVEGLTRPRVAFVFASGFDADELGRAVASAREKLRGAVPVGCLGGGVVGRGEEVEGEPAVSVLAALLAAHGNEHDSSTCLPQSDESGVELE